MSRLTVWILIAIFFVSGCATLYLSAVTFRDAAQAAYPALWLQREEAKPLFIIRSLVGLFCFAISVFAFSGVPLVLQSEKADAGLQIQD